MTDSTGGAHLRKGARREGCVLIGARANSAFARNAWRGQAAARSSCRSKLQLVKAVASHRTRRWARLARLGGWCSVVAQAPGSALAAEEQSDRSSKFRRD